MQNTCVHIPPQKQTSAARLATLSPCLLHLLSADCCLERKPQSMHTGTMLLRVHTHKQRCSQSQAAGTPVRPTTSRLVHGRGKGPAPTSCAWKLGSHQQGHYTTRCCQCACWYAGARHLCAMLSCVLLQSASTSAPKVTNGVASTMRTPKEVPQRN
jgi:hypothetical protein